MSFSTRKATENMLKPKPQTTNEYKTSGSPVYNNQNDQAEQ